MTILYCGLSFIVGSIVGAFIMAAGMAASREDKVTEVPHSRAMSEM